MILIQLTSIECLLCARCCQALIFHILVICKDVSMEELSPRERPVGIEEEGVGTLQSTVTSSLSERGAAPAGGRAGTALGATFPGRPDRGRSARPGRSSAASSSSRV